MLTLIQALRNARVALALPAQPQRRGSAAFARVWKERNMANELEIKPRALVFGCLAGLLIAPLLMTYLAKSVRWPWA